MYIQRGTFLNRLQGRHLAAYPHPLRILTLGFHKQSVKLSFIMRNNSELKARLKRLGLSEDEAVIFMCLIDAPKTLLEVSRVTGIHRSSVYRIVDGLIEKSIVHEVTTDNGKLIAAAQPGALELLVIEQEKIAESRRSGFNQLLPFLSAIKDRDNAFAVRTYSGVAGVKQMLWNELKTQTGILMFSCGPLELAVGRRWAEKYRVEIIERGIVQRSIENPEAYEPHLSAYKAYSTYYLVKQLPKEMLSINHELTIHDDTISLYNSWTDNTQLGTEIKNPFLATFMRQMFEHYWSLAKDPQSE